MYVQRTYILKYKKNNMFRPFTAIIRFCQALKIVLYTAATIWQKFDFEISSSILSHVIYIVQS
jgi:hypothetical protein